VETPDPKDARIIELEGKLDAAERDKETLWEQIGDRDKHAAELVSRLDAAEKERDKADRRAGAAERQGEQLAEEARARRAWLSRAKADWGVDDRVSFDVVWKEALDQRSRLGSVMTVLDRLYKNQITRDADAIGEISELFSDEEIANHRHNFNRPAGSIARAALNGEELPK
jgi:chromosome segregation ATPase